MEVFAIDPLHDPRWAEFICRHPQASLFHSPGWLEALRRTYGYQPVAFTTAAPGAELANGLLFCQVKSWLTGSRIVSLPFSDHCAPLVRGSEDLMALAGHLQRIREREGWKYIEMRPLPGAEPCLDPGAGFHKGGTFYFHMLDLRPDLERIHKGFHSTSIRQRIQRAERDGVLCEEGRSEALLAQFYHLIMLTRRRHQLPPQPIEWFRNLAACLGDALKIHIASKDGQPIAGIIMLDSGKTHIYKYGASDAQFHNLGGMAALLWKAIQQAKQAGAVGFDWGRSDCDNETLVTFKERWGAARLTLTYWRCPEEIQKAATEGWQMRLAKQLFSRAPDRLLGLAGRLLYRHIG
jgi:hypothetical protein